MYEYQVQAAVEFVFRSQGSPRDAYPSIVASGANACILHYVENQRRMEDGDLLLIDAGCEYGYFAADITRTFPVNGRFTGPQRAVYEVVLKAQLAAIEAGKPGVRYEVIHEAARRVIAEGLVDLKLVPRSVADTLSMHHYREFFMHGTGHWLGMDVHDVGDYRVRHQSRALEPGMVFTVEPGSTSTRSARVSPSTCASTARRRCGSAACAWAWPPPRSSRTRRRPRPRPSPIRSPGSCAGSASGSRTTSSSRPAGWRT